MDPFRAAELCEHYRTALLADVLPFWLTHSLDREYGGYLTCLDRQGLVYDTDKPMWLQARQVWLLAKLYNVLEPRPEWLDAARLGYRFVVDHGYDDDGRMFFLTTRDGRPLRKRRYLFTETFGTIACAQYAHATGDERAWDSLIPKVNPATRRTRSHAMPMILLATSQEMRELDDDPLYQEVIDEALDAVLHHFVKRDLHALLETVGPDGDRLDSPEGRLVNPGHAIETSWFILREGARREDATLVTSALDILRWSLDWGWDQDYGGILYFVDIEGRPPHQLEWDMKLWWPHTEALYALLLASRLTGDPFYVDWYERVHAWAWDHFADPEHGEWYGYLHRDGSVALDSKGSIWKGCFHLPRALLYGMQLLQQMSAQGEA